MLCEDLKSRLDANRVDGIDPEQLRAAMPAMIAEARHPAGHAGVRDVIGRRLALFPQPQRSDGEWAAWWADYCDTLADLPHGALEAGMQAWVKQIDAEFMPKPGKLRELAMTTPNRAAIRFDRAQAALNHKPTVVAFTPRGIEEPDANAKAQVKRLLEEYQAGFKAKEVPAFPASNPPLTESGVSPLMRAVRDRQLAEREAD